MMTKEKILETVNTDLTSRMLPAVLRQVARQVESNIVSLKFRVAVDIN